MNKKIVLSFLIFVLLLVGLGMATVLVQKRQEIRKKAAADYTASLSLVQTEREIEAGESFEVNVVLNTGGQTAVGQPRDGDPKACYSIYNSKNSIFSFHRVEYDIKKTQKKMQKAKLPQPLIDRLSFGR